jgi:hypothetical protein
MRRARKAAGVAIERVHEKETYTDPPEALSVSTLGRGPSGSCGPTAASTRPARSRKPARRCRSAREHPPDRCDPGRRYRARARRCCTGRRGGGSGRVPPRGAASGGRPHVYAQTGENIGETGLAACRAADAVLKGPVGLPNVLRPDGTEGGLLGGTLRRGLNLYANVRPVRLWPGVTAPLDLAPGAIDYVIVRENTEGLHASRGHGVANAWAAADTLLMTRPGVERIVRFAFDRVRERDGAPADGIRRVTCIDKANVLRSFAFFRAIFDEVAAEFPDVEPEHLYTDAAAQALGRGPRPLRRHRHRGLRRRHPQRLGRWHGRRRGDVRGRQPGIGHCGVRAGARQRTRPRRYRPREPVVPGARGRHDARASWRASGRRYGSAGVADALEAGAVRIGADGCPVQGTARATAALRERVEKRRTAALSRPRRE